MNLMTETATRLPDSISSGSHANPEAGMCVMETVAYIAGEPHSDQPQCACPVITRAAIKINDAMPDDATRTRLLGPLAFRIAGTRAPLPVMVKRAFIAADYAVRVFAPMALDARGLHAQAATLRALARIIDRPTALAGQKAYAAYANAYAAANAAANAAYAAYAYANADAHAAYAAYAAANAAANAANAATYAKGAWEKAAEMLAAMCEATE